MAVNRWPELVQASHEGFKQSKMDPCLFLHRDCIMLVYTDDCLIFSKDDRIIGTLIQNL
jgi:hypothetical protein